LPVTRNTFILVHEPELTFVPESEFLWDLAVTTDSAFKYSRKALHCEAYSSHVLRFMTRDFLVDINDLAPACLQLLGSDDTQASSSVPSSTSSVSTLEKLERPDYLMYLC
jgi:hypothetical protein